MAERASFSSLELTCGGFSCPYAPPHLTTRQNTTVLRPPLRFDFDVRFARIQFCYLIHFLIVCKCNLNFLFSRFNWTVAWIVWSVWPRRAQQQDMQHVVHLASHVDVLQ
ncbi:hypothetical protein ACQJBY_053844 [Aegilops geniculata]